MPKPVFLYVVDFDRLQHYKNRNPPWIKLYADLWDNPIFEALPDASKAHFVGICVLASKHNNRMPLNIEWIEKHISAVTPLDLKTLYASGLLAHSGKVVLAERLQDASAEERERRVETEGEEKRPSDFDRFWEAYPKKRSKGDALKAWNKNGHPGIERLLEVLVLAKSSKDWLRESGQYIPYPATWLNEKCWDDDYGPPIPTQRKVVY